jgi:ATP-dependent exoDNAse (exonuclease V) alpha subunit
MAETTDIRVRTEILADLWLDYRDSEDFKDFIEYNDLGLPIAYAIANSIVDTSPMAEQFINESFRLLIAVLKLEDTGFNNLNDMLDAAEQNLEE